MEKNSIITDDEPKCRPKAGGRLPGSLNKKASESERRLRLGRANLKKIRRVENRAAEAIKDLLEGTYTAFDTPLLPLNTLLTRGLLDSLTLDSLPLVPTNATTSLKIRLIIIRTGIEIDRIMTVIKVNNYCPTGRDKRYKGD